MEGWVYIEREKEICLDSRPTMYMYYDIAKFKKKNKGNENF